MTKEKKPAKKVFYITTAIDYPNANPHMGHAYEKIITDSYARWYRNNSYDVFFLTGTDENSQKIVQAAEQEKKSTEAFLEEKVKIFREFCKMMHISNDAFIRTTDPNHKKIARFLFEKVRKKGDIYKGVYKGEYCTPCESFWTETQLEDGKCPQCKRLTKKAEEEAYFFQMKKYQLALIEHIQKNPEFIIPQERRNEVLARLKEELRDLCVSRSSLKWGIPLEHDANHVIYVWVDALINYLSGVNYPGRDFEKYWKESVHVIGKDIIWFHCVIWPCMLLACDVPLPKQVYVHGFINDRQGEKMSKSKGNVADPVSIIEKYGIDALRYYLLRAISSGEDGKFDEEELIERYNNELGNDLGNLLKRIQTLLRKKNGGIQKSHAKNELHPEEHHKKIQQHMEKRQHHLALEEAWSIVKKINAYLNEKEPWKADDEEKKHGILYNAAEALRFATHYLAAFLPKTSERIAEQLNFKIGFSDQLSFGEGSFSVQKEEMLFPKIENIKKEERKENEKNKYENSTQIKINQKQNIEIKKIPQNANQNKNAQTTNNQNIFPLNLKIAKIIEVKDHPEADKLYVLQVDLGNEKRQICAGIKPFYKKEELLNKHIILVSNLKKAKLRGVESQGMLLAAGENARILTAPMSNPGEEVFLEGYQNRTSQIRYDDFAELDITTKDRKAEVFGKFLKTKSETVQADAEDGLKVK